MDTNIKAFEMFVKNIQFIAAIILLIFGVLFIGQVGVFQSQVGAILILWGVRELTDFCLKNELI
jgi:hypothetical protein